MEYSLTKGKRSRRRRESEHLEWVIMAVNPWKLCDTFFEVIMCIALLSRVIMAAQHTILCNYGINESTCDDLLCQYNDI